MDINEVYATTKKTMNICFIGSFTAGGTERAGFLVANGLADKYNIFLLNTADREPTFKLDAGFKLDHLPFGSIPLRIIKLAAYLRKNKIDVLITVEAMTGIYSIPALMLHHCKHIVWEHANYFQSQGSRHLREIRKIELKSSDAYVVLTQRDQANFKNNFKNIKRLEQIYNIAEPQKETTYKVDSRIIISAGHIRRVKNFIIIPEIAKIVFKKHPDWKWYIYGYAKGEEYEKTCLKLKEYSLQDNVIFCGRCGDMDKAYQDAAMYVMTSLQEGLPMVLLEAKSNKLPLISFDIETGPDEIIRNRINGFLVPPYDIDIMADKICQLIEDDKLRQLFSDCSYLDMEKFDADTVVKKWNQLIDSL